MSLKDKLLSSYLTFQENTSFDNSILDIKDQAIKVFEAEGFPSKKDENWKYTSLNSVTKPHYSLAATGDDAIEFKDVKQYFLNDIDTFKIVFIDGVYSSYLSETTHDGVDVCLLSSALTKPKFKQVIDVYFNKIAKNDSLTALNTAFAKEGAYIYVPKSMAVNRPIQIVHLSTGNEANLMLQPRNLIVAEENAEVQVIERHQSLSSNAVFTNSVTEIYAGKHARVDYY
ncbi:Fe-S cluster assembly protein SufD, partial [Rhodobacterales bacterium LSUCC0246]|nr:Fe-S cluster assembly protein SufD [Rhodobacterales bacterium LSUCC0374]